MDDSNKNMGPQFDQNQQNISGPQRKRTGTIINDEDSSALPDALRTELSEGERKTMAQIATGFEKQYEIEGDIYTAERLLSSGTGEALVLLVTRAGKQFVLKLYYRIPNTRVLEKLKMVSNQQDNLADIISHGPWKDANHADIKYYELQPFYSGGSADMFAPIKDAKELEKIALHIASAIHGASLLGIMNHDVKPANFFYTDTTRQKVVLGDFGIALEREQEAPSGNRDEDQYRGGYDRTPVYAAPEFYFRSDRRDAGITVKSDYYALGMSLISLWMGERELRALGEEKLLSWKYEDNLRYPDDMPPRLLNLVKALTRSKISERAGYDDIQRWAQGATLAIASSQQGVANFRVVFNSSQSKIANSLEELGRLMYEDRELAKRYLYRGQISKWLRDMERNELAEEVDKIVEDDFPQDQDGGLLTTCFFFDPEMPYHGLDGKERRIADGSTADLARELTEHQREYHGLLKNPSHEFYIYLSAVGLKQMAKKYPPLFKRGSEAQRLWQLIYELDPQRPFWYRDGAGNNHACYKVEEVLVNAYKDTSFSDVFQSDIVSDMFIQWLTSRNAPLAGKIRSLLNDARQRNEGNLVWLVLYNLEPRVAYTLQTVDSASDYCFTPSQIGGLINIDLCNHLGGARRSSLLDNLADVKKRATRLNRYLKSKGKYDDAISWIDYCMDLSSRDNANKCGPYDWYVAVFKTISGLGQKPFYYFKKSNKYVRTLDELAQIPKSEVREALHNGHLEAWIALFFQENPKADLKPKFAYEKLVTKYLDFIRQLDSSAPQVKLFDHASGEVKRTVGKVRTARLKLGIWQVFLGLFALVPLAYLIYMLVAQGFEVPSFQASDPWSIIAVMTVVVGALIFFVAGDGNCVGAGCLGLIVSAILFFAAQWLLKSIAPYLHYIFAVVAAYVFVKVVQKGYVKNWPSTAGNPQIFSPQFREATIEPLHYAFKVNNASRPFDYSLKDASMTYLEGMGGVRSKLMGWTLPVGVVAWALSAIYYNGGFNFDKFKLTVAPSARYEQMVGEYKGTFEGRKATLVITEVRGDSVFATLSVKYKKLLEEDLRGVISEGAIHMEDVLRNGRLDGSYEITFDADNAAGTTAMKGVYTSLKYTQAEFEFTKMAAVAEQAEP